MGFGYNRGMANAENNPGAPRACPPPLPPSAGSAPLSEADYALVRQAKANFKAIQKAARTARISAIIGFIIGGLALLSTLLSPSWAAAFVSAGVCVVAAVEFWGCRRMLRSDPRAAVLLGRNQLALLAIIAIYCIVQMLTFNPKELQEALVSRDFRDQLTYLPSMKNEVDRMDRTAQQMVVPFYGLVILVSVVCQGLMARYYFSRRWDVDAFNNQTPEWVRRIIAETQA